jgi:hypothetical protein
MTGNLESPQQGSYESGIGLIRGWMWALAQHDSTKIFFIYHCVT